MIIKRKAVASGFAALLLVQLACTSLTASPDETAGPTTPYGPQLSLAENQSGVLENMLSQIKDNYIYYKTGRTDLDELREKYQAEIDKGLTNSEFNDLMKQFESEFPEGDIFYMTRDDRIKADTAPNTAGYGGIGAFVSFQAGSVPHVVILDIIPDSPAEKMGLQAHDSIYAVDGDPVRAEEGQDVVLRIRGEVGTKVVLTVQTPGRNERDVELTRAQITGTGRLVAQELSGTDVGYIRMPTVGTDATLDEIVSAVQKFSQNSDLKGIIIDLRISGVNSNFPLEQMLTLFMNNIDVDVYSLEDSRTFSVKGQNIAGSQEVPIVVLVGENTNGPAEIFATAVQENRRGTVIGSKTPGSIESLTGFILPNGGQILIASASFRVGGSENLGMDGLNPEVRVQAKWDEIVPTKDPVIQKAVEALEVQE